MAPGTPWGMYTNGSAITLPFGAGGLVIGLLVGLLGSYTDDALGGTAGTVVQVLLWLVSAAFLLSGALALLSTGAEHAGGSRDNRATRAGAH